MTSDIIKIGMIQNIHKVTKRHVKDLSPRRKGLRKIGSKSVNIGGAINIYAV